MLKNNKGITLIALVITIIVLLILAGVSIAMLTGKNGILNQASRAGDETNRAEVLERVNMELNGQLANAMAGDPFDTVAKIEGNLGLDTDKKINGYKVTVASTSTAYDPGNTVTIKITENPSDDTGTFSTDAGVKYDSATSTWKVTPLTYSAANS